MQNRVRKRLIPALSLHHLPNGCCLLNLGAVDCLPVTFAQPVSHDPANLKFREMGGCAKGIFFCHLRSPKLAVFFRKNGICIRTGACKIPSLVYQLGEVVNYVAQEKQALPVCGQA